MIQSRRDLRCQQIGIQDIEAVDSFTYLGTEVTIDDEQEVEIQRIIMSGNKSILLPVTYQNHD
jgi:hypothetical protein